MLQDGAFLELSLLSQQPGAAAWRRQEIFADETGAAWHVVAQVCLDQASAEPQQSFRMTDARHSLGTCVQAMTTSVCLPVHLIAMNETAAMYVGVALVDLLGSAVQRESVQLALQETPCSTSAAALRLYSKSQGLCALLKKLCRGH